MNTNEVETKNLYNEQAITKMQKFVSHNSICMFTTLLDQFPLRARPMVAQKVCDQGNFWFLSAVESNKNIEIRMDERVQLFFSNLSDSEYLSVYGKASVSTSKEKIEELWTPLTKAWFSLGKNDPKLTILKVVPEDAFYWDTTSGKMISAIKIMTAAVTGIAPNAGVSGKLILG